MKDKVLYLEQGQKYSDKKEGYFMVQNWIFDEGEYLDLDVYEKFAFLYIIRLVNKKDDSEGKGDIFYLSAEQLAKVGGYSLGKAKNVLKKLQEHGYIKKIKTWSNLTGRSNIYKLMNLEPQYVAGVEVLLSNIEREVTEEKFNELLLKSKGTVYYYHKRNCYSHRKVLPLLVDTYTGKVN